MQFHGLIHGLSMNKSGFYFYTTPYKEYNEYGYYSRISNGPQDFLGKSLTTSCPNVSLLQANPLIPEDTNREPGFCFMVSLSEFYVMPTGEIWVLSGWGEEIEASCKCGQHTDQ